MGPRNENKELLQISVSKGGWVLGPHFLRRVVWQRYSLSLSLSLPPPPTTSLTLYTIGIMKGASICDVDQRYFAVFAALLNKDRLITNPARIEELLHYSEKEVVPKEIVVIPWQTEEIALVFSDQQQLLPKIEILNELVDRVEKEDPWVKERFGVSGSGEGWDPPFHLLSSYLPFA